MGRALWVCSLIAVLPGCMTMNMLKTAGEGYMDGEFGMATTALALAPLMLVPDAIDVVTLGAASQPREQSLERAEPDGETSAMLGSLLQVAGQAAQASGAGQSYESGLLMQGVGAALSGNDAASKQVVANAQQYEQSNRVLQQQQAALRQQQYLQQQAAATAETARQQAWNEQNQRAWEARQASASQGQTSAAGSGFTYTDAVNACVSIRPNPNVKNAERIHNTCSVGVRVLFCTEGVVNSGDFKGKRVTGCSKRLFGAVTLAAGGSDIHNFEHVGVATYFMACPDPYYMPANKASFSNGGFSGRCQK